MPKICLTHRLAVWAAGPRLFLVMLNRGSIKGQLEARSTPVVYVISYRQQVKDPAAILPRVGVAVLGLALVVKTVHLDPATLVRFATFGDSRLNERAI